MKRKGKRNEKNDYIPKLYYTINLEGRKDMIVYRRFFDIHTKIYRTYTNKL